MLLMQDARLMLLDEPVAGMSPEERRQTAELLTAIAANRAMVVIEHDMHFVEAIAHKVTVLHQGKLLCEGSMEEVQRDPRVVDVYLGQ
jgi:urea transport system ATP-binding protein